MPCVKWGYHHEKLDGSGYYEGLSGTDIPISARIFAIADVFDALTSKRLSFAKIRSDEKKATESSTIGKHAIIDGVHMMNIECKCDNGILIREKLGRFFKKLTKSGNIWMYPMIFGIEMKGNVG
jgi:hypothetical protein